MLFLALAVGCSTAIAALFKATEGRVDRTALLTVNYLAAVVVAGGRLASDERLGWSIEPGAMLLGAAVGVLFIGGFAVFSLAIGAAGMALATGTMRLSVAIPFAASWLVWGEVPSPAQGGGLVLAASAFLLIARQRPTAETTANLPTPDRSQPAPDGFRAALLLGLLFLAGGLGDTFMKAFEETFAAGTPRPVFLAFVFGVAFAVGAVLVGVRRWRTGVWPHRRVWGWGLLLGALNYGSAEFILLALAELPGTVVFPANSVAIVALATLLGVTVWGERLSRVNGLGLALAAVALILLAR